MALECHYGDCDETFDSSEERLVHSAVEHLGRDEKEFKRKYPNMTGYQRKLDNLFSA